MNIRRRYRPLSRRAMVREQVGGDPSTGGGNAGEVLDPVRRQLEALPAPATLAPFVEVGASRRGEVRRGFHV